MKRRTFLKTGSAGVLGTGLPGAGLVPWLAGPARAAGRGDTLVAAIGYGINSLDIHRPGTNRPAYQVPVNVYDRLVRFGAKQLPNGTYSYDYTTLEPELAESWELAADGLSATFHLRRDARFIDGSPVTAEDVRWSFDRAVSVGGFPSTQMKAGSLEKPEQFVAVDEHTFRIDFLRKSKLTLPDLAVPVAVIYPSRIGKAQATADDPWALEYFHRNAVGSGAYKLERWDAGQQFVYIRNEDWASGPKPYFQRVIIREVPSPATRRALVERGDVDVLLDMPDRDTKALLENGRIAVASAPIENCLYGLALNTQTPPLDDKRVRQAIAHAMPYRQIVEAAAYGRGLPLFGGRDSDSIAWPQPSPYDTDLDKARALLAEAGVDGFDTTLALNLGLVEWQEPACLLIQESLARIGINVSIEKIPGADWRTRVELQKSYPMAMFNFGGWLNYPDYYFFWCYNPGTVFNTMNYDNAEFSELVDRTLHAEVDDPDYAPGIRRLIDIAFDELPLIPLYQPFLDVSMQPDIDGYQYWFHRQLDVRPLNRA